MELVRFSSQEWRCAAGVLALGSLLEHTEQPLKSFRSQLVGVLVWVDQYAKLPEMGLGLLVVRLEQQLLEHTLRKQEDLIDPNPLVKALIDEVLVLK